MVKHNNVIPNVHLRKHWQRNVRVWLNQAGRKSRRLIARRVKAEKSSPRLIENLRPAVRCQTIRYNHRTRLGKGFTLEEIKAVGLGVNFARTIGITVDHRRKNRSQEGFEANKARLTSYLNKLVLFPQNNKKPISKAKSGILNDTPQVVDLIIQEQQIVNEQAVVNTLAPLVKRVKAITKADLEALKKNNVYRSLRQEWSDQRNEGKRI